MITPKRLVLDGWLGYDKEDIDLSSPGITYVRGNIGAGKSAVPEAIYYLLYGKTLRGKDSVNDLVNKIIDEGYEICLYFEIDGVDYQIKEIRGRSTSGLYFYKGDRDLRGKTDPETRKRIIATLGMSDQVFQSLAFLGQNQTQVLVEGTPGARGKALVDIYSLEVYDAAINILKSDLTNVKNDKIDKERELDQLLSDINAIKETITEDIPNEDFDGEIESISVKISNANSKIEKIRGVSNDLIAKIAKQRGLRDKQKKLEELEKNIEKKRIQLQDMKRPEVDLSELRAELQELRSKQVLLVETVTRAKREIDKANRLVNTCPITEEDCPVDVPKKHKEKIINRCNKVIQSSTEKEQDTGILISKLEKNKKDTQEHDQLASTIKIEEDNLKAFGDIPTAEDTVHDEEKLEKCRDSLKVGSDKISKLQAEREKVLSRRAAYREIQIMKGKLETALKEKQDKIDRIGNEILAFDEELKYTASAIAVFKKTKLYKIDIIIDLLNKNIKSILGEISDGEYSAEFVSQKKAESSDRLLDKISIIVHDDYKSMPIELWSGGQKTEVGLAVLLSVWKTATDLAGRSVSCLWLDEVFGPLDRDAVDRVFTSVMDVARGLGTTSVKIISHRDLDTRLFDEIWSVRQDSGISSIEISRGN